MVYARMSLGSIFVFPDNSTEAVGNYIRIQQVWWIMRHKLDVRSGPWEQSTKVKGS